MKKRLWFVFLLAGFLVIPFSTGHAEGGPLVGLKVGTLGVGPEVGVSFNRYLGARLGFNYLPVSYGDTINDNDFNFDLNLQNVGAMVDLHPFKNAFRITGGIFYNGNDLDAKLKPSSGTFKIGDHKYPASLVGNLKGNIDFNQFAPYCGIGVDTTFGKSKSFGFTLDLGILFQGSPDVDLSSDGALSGNQVFQRDLAKEERDVQDELDKFQYYPVISVGINYRF